MNEFKHILLVEDSDNDVELTLEALAEHKLANEVAVARDGVQALDYLFCRNQFAHRADGFPVLVLLDLKLPKVSGVEVLRQIKSDARMKTIPVVVLTSSREEPDLRRCYELGCNAYVVKPVDFQQFAEAIKKLGCFWGVLNEPPPPATSEGKSI